MKKLIHRLAAPKPLMDGIQRDVELETMSPDDFGWLVAYFGDQFPAYFDAGLAALSASRSSGPEEVTH